MNSDLFSLSKYCDSDSICEVSHLVCPGMTAPTTKLTKMLWWRFPVKAKDPDLNTARVQ